MTMKRFVAQYPCVQRAKQWGLILLSTAVITGCGSGDFNVHNVKSTAPQQTALVLGQEYEVFPQDALEPDDVNTKISVRHEVATDRKYVTLLTGNASLIRGNFVLEAVAQ
jgi:hypothetical protein